MIRTTMNGMTLVEFGAQLKQQIETIKVDPVKVARDGHFILKLTYPCEGVDRLPVKGVRLVPVVDENTGMSVFEVQLIIEMDKHLRCQARRES